MSLEKRVEDGAVAQTGLVVESKSNLLTKALGMVNVREAAVNLITGAVIDALVLSMITIGVEARAKEKVPRMLEGGATSTDINV